MEKTQKLKHHAPVNYIILGVSNFYALEQLDIQCFPTCGGCKCGPSWKDITLKEVRAYKMITYDLKYHPEGQRWETSYPFVKDLENLLRNKTAALSILYSTK